MVSRTETARALLTPGEVMQLPPSDEIVMAAGIFPIRANKARYFADPRLQRRVLPPPKPYAPAPDSRPVDDWTGLRTVAPVAAPAPAVEPADEGQDGEDEANAGIRREPDLPEHEEIVPIGLPPRDEFDFEEGEASEDSTRNLRLRERMSSSVRQAALDPDDGIDL
jgi:type IV secretion system protein VirD4